MNFKALSLGFIGLQFVVLSILFALPTHEIAARLFAAIAVWIFTFAWLAVVIEK